MLRHVVVAHPSSSALARFHPSPSSSVISVTCPPTGTHWCVKGCTWLPCTLLFAPVLLARSRQWARGANIIVSQRVVRNAANQTGGDAEDTRRGFQVNTKYKGARSYGSVDEDELAEAERVRGMYNQEIRAQQAAATKRFADARKRLLRRRLRQGRSWQPELSYNDGSDGNGVAEVAGESAILDDDDADEESGSVDAAALVSDAPKTAPEFPEQGSAGNSPGNVVASQVVGTVPRTAGEGQAFGSAGAAFPGLADTVTPSVSSGLSLAAPGPQVPLSIAERLASDEVAQRHSSGAHLLAAASALSAAGRHAEAAVLLRHLRDFGVERDILTRRLSLAEAEMLFQEASLGLGLELQSAGMLTEAWAALLAACAERLPWKPRQAVCALAAVALQLASRCSREPTRQVEVLQGAVDAATVCRALPPDQRDELELTLALALQAAGRMEECCELLRALMQGASSARRRQQAEWALLVQNADVGSESAAMARELRSLWGETAQGLSPGAGTSTVGSAGTVLTRRRGGGAPGLQFGDFGPNLVLLVALLLAFPLTVPLLAWFRSSGGT
mmetsp:Transcript_37478/g.104134  ORF Transcript_37478/g.104134 Transcript_37478/m.104134 type:complete len:561 (-) Transcript_37478:79-1761(-)